MTNLEQLLGTDREGVAAAVSRSRTTVSSSRNLIIVSAAACRFAHRQIKNCPIFGPASRFRYGGDIVTGCAERSDYDRVAALVRGEAHASRLSGRQDRFFMRGHICGVAYRCLDVLSSQMG